MLRDPNVPMEEQGGYQPQSTNPRPQYNPRSIEEIKQEVDVWDIDTGAQKVLDASGELSQEEMNSMREELGGPMREEFIQGNPAIEEEKQKEASDMFAQKEQYKDLRLTLAQDYLDGNLSQAFMQSPQGEEMMSKLLKDEKQLVKNKCPEGEEDCEDKNSLGVMLTDYNLIEKTQTALETVNAQIQELTGLYNQGGVDDGGVQMDELVNKQKEYQALIESNPQKWSNLQKLVTSVVKVDKATVNVIEDARTKIYKKGLDTLPEDKTGFNEEHTRQTVDNAIMGKGNLQSMIYDSMLPGFRKDGTPRTFYTDLKDYIMGVEEGGRTYGDFGITNEMLGQGDVNADGIIDEQEAENIAQTLVNDEGLVREQLGSYFTQYLRSNYELGLSNRRESYIKEDIGGADKRSKLNKLEYTPQTESDKSNVRKPKSLNTDWA